MNKLVKSQKTSRFLSQFFTYVYMIALAIIIIYPLLITASSAFKSGNITAFS